MDGDIKFCRGTTFGVGYIFKTRQVLFTQNGKELKCVELPKRLQNRILYPAISIGSRENHKCKINLGAQRFAFNLDEYIQNKYYKPYYHEIRTILPREQEDQSIQQQKQIKT